MFLTRLTCRCSGNFRTVTFIVAVTKLGLSGSVREFDGGLFAAYSLTRGLR